MTERTIKIEGVGEIAIRPLASLSDYQQAVEIQYSTWGEDFTECVPSSMLRISQKVGGVAAGAFSDDDKMVGFIYGISGLRKGIPAHWSHMLAVTPEARGGRLGTLLKAYQRDVLLDDGIEFMYWTYDPLIAANANLNINRLSAFPVEYAVNMYGDNTGSDLHSGLGTDRFVVEWKLADPNVAAAVTRTSALKTTRDEGAPTAGPDNVADPPDSERVYVEIPADIIAMKESNFDQAKKWRECTRSHLSHYLAEGYTVAGFCKGDPAYYYLIRT